MNIIRISRKRDQHKKRVAAYCRVSTLLEEQEDSIETQSNYYQSYIASHDDWDFAGIYSDEKSGLDAEKRKGFQQMIKDALEGRVDYILVKSVSRFSRNVVDCQKYLNLLHGNGVDVYFEKENINTADPSSSMLLSIMSVFAQNESKSISENVKWSIRERVKKGEYNLGNNCNNRMLGYDSIGGKLIPNQDATVVRAIFSLFLEGRTVADIQKLLASRGVVGKNGKTLTASGITYILTNETYVGDKLLQKRAPKNMLTKQPEKGMAKNGATNGTEKGSVMGIETAKEAEKEKTKERMKKGAYDSNYLVDDHVGIISRAVWEATQRKLQMRKAEIEEIQKTALSSLSSAVATTATTASSLETVDTVAGTGKTVTGTAGRTGSSPMASYGSKTLLFGKIICGDCGSLMVRKTYKDAKKGNNYKVWSCRTPKKGKLPKQPTQDIHSGQDIYSVINVNDCGSSVGCAGHNCVGNNADETGFYCSTKSVRESDIIAEILRQADQEPEAQGSLSASKTAEETGQEAQITAKSDETGKLPRAVEQLLPRIKRIIIGGQVGSINIEWN
ncbi:MAG: recombinase family protein [Synergistaceae bacterium]|nr:recombinase family protein [Synergistaceae bacterium]